VEASSGGEAAAASLPASPLYCPPEQFAGRVPQTSFDIYSAALVWLQVAVPPLASRDALRGFTAAVRDRGATLEEVARPFGLDDAPAFDAASREGRLARELLSQMLCRDPSRRVTAEAALAGPYLSPTGDGEPAKFAAWDSGAEECQQ